MAFYDRDAVMDAWATVAIALAQRSRRPLDIKKIAFDKRASADEDEKNGHYEFAKINRAFADMLDGLDREVN